MSPGSVVQPRRIHLPTPEQTIPDRGVHPEHRGSAHYTPRHPMYAVYEVQSGVRSLLFPQNHQISLSLSAQAFSLSTQAQDRKRTPAPSMGTSEYWQVVICCLVSPPTHSQAHTRCIHRHGREKSKNVKKMHFLCAQAFPLSAQAQDRKKDSSA